MTEITGSARLSRAIENQAAVGEACFSLPMAEARVVCDECEDELARFAWAQSIPAPVDADGEVVPLDTEVLYREDGGKCKVAYWAYYPNEKDSWTAVSDVMGTKRACIPKTLHLTPPDSWGKLEEDAKLAPRAYLEKRGMNPEKTERVASMMADLVRRAKALAGRDAKEVGRG